MSPTISFAVGEGVQKENAMKFWMLTAMTLALAMVAGTAQAQFNVQVSANTNSMRHLKVTDPNSGVGTFKVQMTFWIFNEFEPDRPGNATAPAILGSDYNLNTDLPFLGQNIFFPSGAGLASSSSQIYVLYVSVDGERRRAHSFNVALPNFGTFDGHYQSKGFLGDELLPVDDQFWHLDAMSKELIVEIVREDLTGNFVDVTVLEGTIPAVP
jgi:hypothetical protein